MTDIAVIDALYHIHKYKNYAKLIELFEHNPLVVIENKDAHKIIIGLAKKEIGRGRGGKNTPEGDFRRKYLVNRVYAYYFLGFSLYSSENDPTKINAKQVPTSSTGKTLVWCNKQKNMPHITYDTLKKWVKEDKIINKNKFAFCLLSHLVEVYEEEKGNIDISKAKLNATGTSFDADIFPEFWEALNRG